jgi:hypothetical protein
MEVKNAVFWDMTQRGSCKNRRFGGTSLHLASVVTANVVPSSLIIFTLRWGRHVLPKPRFLQEPHGVKSQKMAFFSHRRENLKFYIALTGWDL